MATAQPSPSSRGFTATLAALLPALLAWARRRLARKARIWVNTQDLVQGATVGALRHEEQLEPAGERGIWAYLRKSVINLIRDELRRSRQGEVALAASEPRRDPEPSPEARL